VLGGGEEGLSLFCCSRTLWKHFYRRLSDRVMGRKRREKVVNFNPPENRCFVLILSLNLTAGVGAHYFVLGGGERKGVELCSLLQREIFLHGM
jgi:hypothetical protein